MSAHGVNPAIVRGAAEAARSLHAGASIDDSDYRSPSYPSLPHDGSRAGKLARKQLKFFLVEDNAIIRQNLAETLAEMFAATIVGVADAASEATRWLVDPTHEWDVAVVDIFLKRGNGIEVLAALRGNRHQQKVVVLSNYATSDIRKTCLLLGADAVFDKSTELDGLIEFCANVQAH